MSLSIYFIIVISNRCLFWWLIVYLISFDHIICIWLDQNQNTSNQRKTNMPYLCVGVCVYYFHWDFSFFFWRGWIILWDDVQSCHIFRYNFLFHWCIKNSNYYIYNINIIVYLFYMLLADSFRCENSITIVVA